MHHHRGAVMMRRVIFAAALLSVGCYNPSGVTSTSSGVYRLLTTSNASAQGTFVGDQVQVDATPVDINGIPLSVPVTFASSVTSVATISTTGLISAVGGGTTVIVMNAGAVTLQVPFIVDGNITGSIVVGPNTASIKVGAQQLFTAIVLTTKGNPAHSKTVTWSSTDLTRATVDVTGRATAIATTAGVSICAAAADVPSITGCAALTVTP
jgi:trimeric autotransporter adhesin